MMVSVCIIAWQEEMYLPLLLSDLREQTWPKANTELLLVDSGSTDRTRQLMNQFAEEEGVHYSRIAVLENPRQVQPAGWNVGVAHARGEIFVRLEAHARIPADFLEANVQCIQSGEKVCGGKIDRLLKIETARSRMLRAAEESMFGGGFGQYRKKKENCYVKTIGHTAYAREVINKVGLFREDCVRTEDNEYHWRVRQAGYRICFAPLITSGHYMRENLLGNLRQKYGNGYWVMRTMRICPGCISLYHLVPFFFVLAVLMTGGMALAGFWQPALLLWIIYGAGCLMMSIPAWLQSKRNGWYLLLPGMFLLLHGAYGCGSVAGGLSWLKKEKNI